MKKYIKITYAICFFIVMITILCATFLMFYNTRLNDTKESLKITAEVVRISKIPQDIDLQDYVRALAYTNKNLRVTLIDHRGTVLGDSQVQALSMENHLDRGEVIRAIQTGFGEEIRASETTGIKTIYTATKVNEDLILRFSYPLVVTYDFLKTMLPITLVISLLMILIMNKFANNLSEKLVSPIVEINKLLENKGQVEIGDAANIKSFKEVQPILNNIDYLIKKLNYDFAQMEKTQQMRTDFVANVSHELKSPLTSIKGFADLMSSGLISKKEQQNDYLKRIVKESDRLLSIINDILYLSEVESIKVPSLEMKTMSLDKVANDVIKSLEGLRADKRIILYTEGQGHIQAVEKDIWEMIYNLVDNGIKYGKQKGFIKVQITNTDKVVTLIVKDNGIGIDGEHLGRIFERFYRVDTSRSRTGGGTGLGLSIVRNIVAKYDGKIGIKSTKDIGTTITIEFKSFA
ncbi:MAG TPA: GHKL domain-containing protein [Epulopiscium sp.]|nr:GHKL domain-containing protein [Candidatus Epulonipiscium sp.]